MYVMVQDLFKSDCGKGDKLIGEICWSKGLMAYSQTLVTRTSCHRGNNVILYEEWPDNFKLIDGLNYWRSMVQKSRDFYSHKVYKAFMQTRYFLKTTSLSLGHHFWSVVILNILFLAAADVSPLPGGFPFHHPGRAGGPRAESPHLSLLHAGLRWHGSVRVRGSRLQLWEQLLGFPFTVYVTLIFEKEKKKYFSSVTCLKAEVGCKTTMRNILISDACIVLVSFNIFIVKSHI